MVLVFFFFFPGEEGRMPEKVINVQLGRTFLKELILFQDPNDLVF